MLVVTRGVHSKVEVPTESLLTHKSECSDNWCVLSQLSYLVDHFVELRGILLTSAGNEYHVAIEIAGGIVMLGVSDLPREVWNKQE